MRKEVNLRFRKGRYELILIVNGQVREVSWAGLMSEITAGWNYDNQILTVKLKFGNNVVQKDYDCEFNPMRVCSQEFDLRFNKEVAKLFRKIEKDYSSFIQEMKELEFEERIFNIEY